MTDRYDRRPLAEAVRYLAGRCDYAVTLDGVGFNGADAGFGHKMAEMPAERWSTRQARAVWRMIAKYKAQLARGGIDYAAIAEPPEAEDAPAVPKRIDLEGDRFALTFPYSREVVAAVKAVPGRWWDKERTQGWDHSVWTVKDAPAAHGPLAELAAAHGFEVSPDALARFGTAQAERERAAEASRAKDADLPPIPGLRGGELLPFQKAGTKVMIEAARAVCADDVGLGKTIEALATLEALEAFPAVVVCGATLKPNWEREARKWLPSRSVTVINGGGLDLSADITILNYDILKKHAAALNARRPAAVVLDESHRVKNHKAQRTVAAKALTKGVRVRLLLTGTPAVNRPQELISQFQIAGRLDEFGGFWGFAERYCGAHRNQWGWDLSGATNLEELNARLRASGWYVRRTKAEVLPELPRVRVAPVYVTLSNRAEYARAEADCIRWIGEQAAKQRDFLESIAHLPEEEQAELIREHRAGAEARAARAETLTRIGALRRLAGLGKLDAASDWVESFLESGEKLVVFAHHVDIQDALAAQFPGCARIVGGIDPEITDAEIQRFQNDPECKLMVASLQAGSEGITLTAASNVLFVERGWTPKDHTQAEGRVCRIGQTAGSVTAWYLTAEATIDEDMAELIASKRAVVDAITDGAPAAETQSVMGDLVRRLADRALGAAA